MMRADGAAHVCACWAAQPIPSGTAEGHRAWPAALGQSTPAQPVPQFPLQLPKGSSRAELPARSVQLLCEETGNGDNDSKRLIGRVTLARGKAFWHSWNHHRAVRARSWDAQLLAPGDSWSQCPGPCGGHQPGGDTDPHGEVTAQSSRWQPLIASPGTALEPSAPEFSTPGGREWGHNRPHRSGETKGPGTSCSLECPLPSAPFPGIRFPSSQATRAFQAQAFRTLQRWGQSKGPRAGGLRGLGEVAERGVIAESREMHPKSTLGSGWGDTSKHHQEMRSQQRALARPAALRAVPLQLALLACTGCQARAAQRSHCQHIPAAGRANAMFPYTHPRPSPSGCSRDTPAPPAPLGAGPPQVTTQPFHAALCHRAQLTLR